MVETAVVLLAVVGAIVFVMRMDEDPNRWLSSRASATGRHRRTDEAPAPETGASRRSVSS
ncbi:MAG: hypothetical protein ACLGIA_06275 [Actinomycetes bacterium]